jgi:hypothetical protein
MPQNDHSRAAIMPQNDHSRAAIMPQNDHTQDIFELLRGPPEAQGPRADIFTYNNMLMYVPVGKARGLFGPHPSCNIPATHSVFGPDQLSTWCRCFPRSLAAGVKRWDVSAQIVEEMVARGMKIAIRTYTILMDGTDQIGQSVGATCPD